MGKNLDESFLVCPEGAGSRLDHLAKEIEYFLKEEKVILNLVKSSNYQ